MAAPRKVYGSSTIFESFVQFAENHIDTFGVSYRSVLVGNVTTKQSLKNNRLSTVFSYRRTQRITYYKRYSLTALCRSVLYYLYHITSIFASCIALHSFFLFFFWFEVHGIFVANHEPFGIVAWLPAMWSLCRREEYIRTLAWKFCIPFRSRLRPY